MEKKKKESLNDRVNAELAGIGLYGTTSNEEIAGYQTSGDIENAGQLDKGFKRPEGKGGAQASLKDNKEKE
ncbi:hypothetical protein ACFSKI_07150 [Pseudogracilibacillus auburnensis]|uniref:Uncharacterized protein n=1 Tax=Pseudogracilibacillus auburnensis TaxID=1494959 RepID=A0A2V3VNX2_9BACI|nr:hypothetical protein [Pseudogracilibacillus auburnensis]MBO1005482.1 hypothetical protein [Pseudogracilibacillus auburnensis]PXW83557.1 hypothetical protein DFR56_11525 [Pseudogracilibacillus auburnensis]